MPKINVEIISLFFHHTSFFAVNSNNSVTLDVARKKKNESGKTRLLRVKMSLLCPGGNCFEISLCESQQIKRSKPILDMADYFCLSGYFHSLSALISKNVGFQWVAAAAEPSTTRKRCIEWRLYKMGFADWTLCELG